jgi:hypothetical protein
MVEPSQAGAEGRAIEVHEESRGISRELQIRDHLRETHGMKVIDGFQLHDDAVVDQQVDAEASCDAMPFVVQGNPPLALDSKLRPSQLDEQAFTVHRFQEARSENPVHFDSAPDDLLRQLPDVLSGGIHAPAQSTKRAELFF